MSKNINEQVSSLLVFSFPYPALAVEESSVGSGGSRMSVSKQRLARICRVIGIVLIFVMIGHVTLAWYHHLQHPEYSAPAWINLSISLYYLIPIAALFVGSRMLDKRADRI